MSPQVPDASSTANRRTSPVVYAVIGVAALLAAGYGALSCQGVRSSIITAAETPYKPPASSPVRAKGAPPIAFDVVVENLASPTDLRMVPGSPSLLVVLGKGGDASWHDLTTKTRGLFFHTDVRDNSELGLLGIAFHPKFEENGRFFVNENPKAGPMRTRISEYRANPKDIAAGATFVKSILEVTQPYPNHDGGQVLFGPDGFLYIGLGDGGWRGDPDGNGQDLKTLLGAILRIDVDNLDAGKAYGIPKDNPFVGRTDARGEIYAYGIRNPWRFTFADDGRLIVADVGQDQFEEVTLVRKGENHGWNIRESAHCYSPASGCATDGLVDPVFEYDHSVGASITGGIIYRGKALPSLQGKYLFADFVRGHLWAMDVPSVDDTAKGIDPNRATRLGTFPALWSAFTPGPDGEVFVADFSGKVVQLTVKAAEAASPSK